jgi:membrane-bound serine protease (ClpP class)
MKYLAPLGLLFLLAGAHPSAQAPARPDAVVLEIDGPIGPAISDFIERNIADAAAKGSKAVILRIDTPGGLDTSMRDIIKAILASPIPVVSYVSPGGARAASAGTYILYASHVAAMAPATNLGAATPVPISPGALPGGDGDKQPEKDKKRAKDKKDEGEDQAGDEEAPASPGGAMQRKIVNDAVAYIRGLAALRGRNADWAEKAVREGASLSAEDALKENVVDLLAENIEALVTAINGRTVKVRDAEHTIDTAGWQVAVVEPDWRTKFLSVITNPNVAYVLMLLGIYGLFFEMYNPGAVVPGVVGAISLLLALYAFHVLPVNYAGVALILVGIALIVTELFTPAFGVLGIGGVVAFITGSIILYDTDVEGLRVSMPLLVTVSIAAAGLFTATIVLALRQRERPVVTGREEMIGAVGEALGSFTGAGQVLAHGEVWSARSALPVAAGQRVRIRNIDGLILEIEPLEEET